jgi:hypothetical protein
LEDRCLLSFLPTVTYPVGLTPQAVVTGDFNGDGRLDLAVANAGDNTVSVLLGNGDGTFQAAGTSSTGLGLGPQLLVAGDLNRDGRTDLVTGNNYNNGNGSFGDLSVLLGNGDGTFQPPRSIVLPGQFPPGYTGTGPVAQTPYSVALGDLNGDGKLDLVATGRTEYKVIIGYDYDLGVPIYEIHVDFYFNVLLGNGDGTFGPGTASHLDFSPSGPSSVELGDFNNDGRLDVAYGGGGGLNVRLGNGDGTLQAPIQSVGTASGPVGDFNGDGKLDILGPQGVWLGNGDGTFRPGQFLLSLGMLDAGDVNGAGKLDVVSVDSNYNTASVLLGSGDGSFAVPITSNLGILPPNNYFTSVVLANFEGNGHPDLVATAMDLDYANPGFVVVAHNDGNWRPPTEASSFVVSGFPSPTSAGVAGSFTVTARKFDGSIDTGYTGTVHFTSSDSQAGLPADYTFTAADQGVHAFTGTLKTAGTQSITARDTAFTSITGSEVGITVNPVAASIVSVTGFPSTATAGVAGNFTVTLKDLYGTIATGYTGTVHFTSSDAKALLPSNYTFTTADAGVHTFSATLKTAGTQSITATDIAAPGLVGSEGGITVNPAAASQFVISGPSSVSAGVPFSLTIKVEDAYGNVVTGYTGTVHFSSTDNKATLPANYTFTAADKGVHTFTGLVLRKKGKPTITITDTLNSSLTGSVIENVN